MKKEKALSLINPMFLKGICHRGLHNEQFCENGMNAFKNALDHNLAIELDVHLTKDGQLIILHDSDMKRMTGKEGIVEDLTLAQIKSDYRLLDGEQLPTLQEVFALVQEKVPIVVELKVHNKNYKALTAKVEEEIKVIKDKKNIMLISFDPRALFPFKGKGYIRQFLIAEEGQYAWPFRIFFDGADIDCKCFNKRKYIQYARNHFTNIWTVETQDILDKFAPLVDTVTFQKMDADCIKNYYRKF